MTREEVHFVSAQTVIFENYLLGERVSKLEEDFKKNFEFTSILIKDLEASLIDRIQQLQPQENNRRAALLEEYKRLSRYRDELKEIDVDIQACEEAANWLDKNRRQLINYVCLRTFDDGCRLMKFNGVQVNREAVQLFCQDLNIYLQWVGHYLRMGTPPKDMPKGVIALALPSEIYIEAFKLITNDKISVGAGLSERAVTMLRSSINRFLVKGQLELDATQPELRRLYN